MPRPLIPSRARLERRRRQLERWGRAIQFASACAVGAGAASLLAARLWVGPLKASVLPSFYFACLAGSALVSGLFAARWGDGFWHRRQSWVVAFAALIVLYSLFELVAALSGNPGDALRILGGAGLDR